MKVHLYPEIPLYNAHEAVLKASLQAKDIVKQEKRPTIPEIWFEEETAMKAAKRTGQDMWRSNLIITFGKYSGQTFKWLLENDVGWVIWLLSEFVLAGEKSLRLKWQKQHLLDFVQQFSPVKIHLDRRLKKKQKKEVSEDWGSDYYDDAELLTIAEDVLQSSEVAVSTKITTVKNVAPSSTTSTYREEIPDPPISTRSHEIDSDTEVLEGWQKFWDEPPPQVQGMMLPNIKWLKTDGQYGIFQPAKPYKNSKGEVVQRKLFKNQIEFNPPPIPTSITAIPNMLSFFTTRVFFWRPVGVLQVKIKCPNRNCPAPPGSYLNKCGFGNIARQVCGLNYFYTLLTERLQCVHCMKLRKDTDQSVNKESDNENENQQYRWHSYSPSILMNLAPAIRSMFPAILCGKRAIDKNVVTLLSDRLNAVSMTKVQRLVQQGHDEWYTDRRDLYQTLLYEAHTASSMPSQQGILGFIKPEGSYTPPISKTPLPSARVLRRAHLIMEMERIPVYRASILSTTGEILCIDGTRQILKKIYGDGQGTMQYLTSVLNEWGQFLTTVVVASESEDCYRRMAQGLIARFKRANAPPPKVIYADNNCCSESGTSWIHSLFEEWDGMVVRLDIRHWLHRWDTVVIKQSHSKYGVFMSALAGAILAYNKADMDQLIKAVRNGNQEMYSKYSDMDMIAYVKPHQRKSYVRRITRGVEESVCSIEAILKQFKGPAGLDVDGIPLFKSSEAVDAYWQKASKHISCMQDPPGIPLYVVTKVVNLNGVLLNKYRCRRGSNSLEGLHAHLVKAIPSQRCGIMPFQVYLISFAMQWNCRMESLKVAGGQGRHTLCMDARQIQRLNHQANVLFGKEHLLEPNFAAPMPYPKRYDDPAEKELLGVEYAYCQSSDFKAKDYYIKKVSEEQSQEEEEEEESGSDSHQNEDTDEGIDVLSTNEEENDVLGSFSSQHAILTKEESVADEVSPALQDVLMSPSHLHLPGYEEVERLALLLLELADESNSHIIPVPLRQKIATAAQEIHEHDKSSKNFVKKYESKWGYTLFGRCLGPDTPQSSAAQKTKFGWMRYAQASQITDESRLLYLLIKILKNRPGVSHFSSPTKIASHIKGEYKRIVDRIRDDPVLYSLAIPLPNINNKSITNFITKEEKKANYRATAIPKVITHQRVLSDQPMPESPSLPTSLPQPERPQMQYTSVPHTSGKRPGEKRRWTDVEVEEQPLSTDVNDQKTLKSRQSSSLPTLLPKYQPSLGAPVLMVIPSQPSASSITFKQESSSSQGLPFKFSPALPPAPPIKPTVPRSGKPCSACKQPKCAGQRKRYTPSRDKTMYSTQKIFTFCPITKKSTTPGFEKEDFKDFDDFKKTVDEVLLLQAIDK